MRRLYRWLLIFLMVVFVSASLSASGITYCFYRYGKNLPDYQQLLDYEPPTMSRIHASDGRLLAEYARERRVFVPVEAIPQVLLQAFLAAEDKNFYSHPGVDFLSVVRALLTNARNLSRGNRRPVGASTITQQVAKNFLLSNDLTIERKIREAILALRIERALSKERILELYLNEIYLGYGSYGVAAAALNYFNKPLDELTLSEAAFLAALPKGPKNYHPLRRRNAAIGRRNWVIDRMESEEFINGDEAKVARNRELNVQPRGTHDEAAADYFVEEVRRELISKFGETGLYESGLSVRVTLEPRLQNIARRALKQGLIAYDRRHGWRGPLTRFDLSQEWQKQFAIFDAPSALDDWVPAIVLGFQHDKVTIGFSDGGTGLITFKQMRWARKAQPGGRLGPELRSPMDALNLGDVVPVAALNPQEKTYTLEQIPDANGGIVAMDPHTGRVLAMVGGYHFGGSQYNRATQAWRQPGSAFKPIVYAAALERGFTPSSLILDAPFVIDQGPGLKKWKPANYTQKFYGPSTLRLGVEKSRNLMTVRLAQFIGMDAVIEMATRFNLVDEMPPHLSMALGAGETTLLRLVAAYGMLVNGGKRIIPKMIDRIQDRRGRTVFRSDDRNCVDCLSSDWEGQLVPHISDTRGEILNSAVSYQLVSILQGVVERGTGRRVSTIGKPLGGKTGTTNDGKDAWFIGFSPDLVAGVYVGFDQPRSLGKGETGASVAAPIFRDFMTEALDGQPALPFRIPTGVRLVRVNASSGVLAKPGDKNVIFEAFRPGNEPKRTGQILDGSVNTLATGDVLRDDTGGLY